MSESEYLKAQARAALREKAIEAMKAHLAITRAYRDFGLDEQGRDEVLAALGLSTPEDVVQIHGSSVVRALTRAGLTGSVSRGVLPRKDPTRAL